MGKGIANLAQPQSGCHRKASIVAALYRCMARQGYAATSLSDIAGESGMSSSHLLYYFSGREAILASFFKQATRQVEAELAAITVPDAAGRIDALAALLMNPSGFEKGEQGVRLDLYGQAVQDRTMRRIKVAHDRKIVASLRKAFELTGANPGASSGDAARSAYAMLVGLMASSYYDKTMCSAEAHRLFRTALYSLAGLNPAA